jgi:hypothetical protein
VERAPSPAAVDLAVDLDLALAADIALAVDLPAAVDAARGSNAIRDAAGIKFYAAACSSPGFWIARHSGGQECPPHTQAI